MSMYIEADKLKEKFKGFSEDQLNTVLRFGQVAKFRCRSNIAYRNFVEACFSEVAQIEEDKFTNADGESYTKIKAKLKEQEIFNDEEAEKLKLSRINEALIFGKKKGGE